MHIVKSFLEFLRFWFLEAPKGLIAYFFSLNKAFLQLFSVSLLLQSFFKPWKNEYREGLVGFSIAMGIIVKGMTLLVAFIFLGMLVGGEVLSLLLFLLWPFLTVGIIFLR